MLQSVRETDYIGTQIEWAKLKGNVKTTSIYK